MKNKDVQIFKPLRSICLGDVIIKPEGKRSRQKVDVFSYQARRFIAAPSIRNGHAPSHSQLYGTEAY